MRRKPLKNSFKVTFWGVRGTVPTPGVATHKYGGHTSCVQMICGGRELIFDAGTGLYPLGEALDTNEVDIFLSHTHIDHIMGFPFFSGAYDRDYTVRLWAGHLLPEHSIREVMGTLMHPPIFPLTLDDLRSKLSFHDFHAGEDIRHESLMQAGIVIHTLPLNHPDRATAYRVEYAGHAACYVTDVEHRDGTLDEKLLGFIKDADLLIYDSTFDDKDFARFNGWGHSTWQHAARLGKAANVKHVALFHHDPGMTDAKLDERMTQLNQMKPDSYVAYEGLTLELGSPAAP